MTSEADAINQYYICLIQTEIQLAQIQDIQHMDPKFPLSPNISFREHLVQPDQRRPAKKLLRRHGARMGNCNLGGYNAATLKPVPHQKIS